MTEDQIEQFAIERLKSLGYAYAYGPVIAHDGERPERASHEQVLLLERLRAAVRRINPRIPASAQEEAVKQVARIASPELLVNNEVFHRMLTEGVKVDYQQDGNTRGDLVWLESLRALNALHFWCNWARCGCLLDHQLPNQ